METRHNHGSGQQIHHGPDANDSVDPICGMTLNKDTAKYRYDYGGQEYFFCSNHCLESFRAAPDKYAKPTGLQTRQETEQPQAESVQANAAVTYTCPMHPEVIRDLRVPVRSVAWTSNLVSVKTTEEEASPELSR